jgi:hypothetical protein
MPMLPPRFYRSPSSTDDPVVPAVGPVTCGRYGVRRPGDDVRFVRAVLDRRATATSDIDVCGSIALMARALDSYDHYRIYGFSVIATTWYCVKEFGKSFAAPLRALVGITAPATPAWVGDSTQRQ